MKNSFRKIIYVAAVLLSFTVSTEAKRPVWVIAHGANWKYSIEEALKQGANGVEVDVREGTTFWNWFTWHSTEGSHWCLGHDTYWPKEKCDCGNDAAVSLKWVLTDDVTNDYTTKINDDPRFCVLWLDVKDENYIKDLVEYVHRYTVKGQTNYTIIYNVYKNIKDDVLNWLGENLWPNECLNWANKTISELKNHIKEKSPIPPGLPDFLRAAQISANNHFYTMGVFNVDQPQNTTSTKYNNLRDAKGDRSFCRRAGIWSNVTANNAEAWINFGMDVVLTYYSHGYRPTCECKSNALPDLVTRIKFPGFALNNSVYIATRQDKF